MVREIIFGLEHKNYYARQKALDIVVALAQYGEVWHPLPLSLD
jgi:hypothetical protein